MNLDPLICALIRRHPDRVPPALVLRLLDVAEQHCSVVVPSPDGEPDDDAPVPVAEPVEPAPEMPQVKAGFNPLPIIARQVAIKNGVTVCELRARCRSKKLAEARQEYYYRAATETGASWPHIGQYVERDHTTVMHGTVSYCERNDLKIPRGLNPDSWGRKRTRNRIHALERYRNGGDERADHRKTTQVAQGNGAERTSSPTTETSAGYNSTQAGDRDSVSICA